MEIGSRRLRERHIDFRIRRAVDTLLMYVGDDAHHQQVGGSTRRATRAKLGSHRVKSLAQRVAGKELPGEGAVYHSYSRRPLVVVVVKRPPLDDWGAHCAEEIRSHADQRRPQLDPGFPRRQCWSEPCQSERGVVLLDGQPLSQRGVAYRGQGPQLWQRLPRESQNRPVIIRHARWAGELLHWQL